MLGQHKPMGDKISFEPRQRGDTRFWNFTVEIIQPGGTVNVLPGCFAIMVTNIGDRLAYLNGLIIYPGVPGTSLGDSRSISGHVLDLFKGRLDIKFEGAGANPQVEIVQLFYLEKTSS